VTSIQNSSVRRQSFSVSPLAERFPIKLEVGRQATAIPPQTLDAFVENCTRLSPLPEADEAVSHVAQGACVHISFVRLPLLSRRTSPGPASFFQRLQTPVSAVYAGARAVVLTHPLPVDAAHVKQVGCCLMDAAKARQGTATANDDRNTRKRIVQLIEYTGPL
jgi:hypothetical protein